MDENTNLGGTMNRVEKIGNTVHRLNKGGDILHEYLLFLEGEGMPYVPRFLGMDEQGREILTYLPGKTQEGGKEPLLHHPCLHADETLIDVALIMRRLHDLSVRFLPYALAHGWGSPADSQQEPETICHNDAASWNFVFVDYRPAGLFDFDTACPGSRRWDLTTCVFSFLPLLPYGYVPEEQAADRKRRISLFFEAYGMDIPPDFMHLVQRRMEEFVQDSQGPALEHYQRVAAHIREHGAEWI